MQKSRETESLSRKIVAADFREAVTQLGDRKAETTAVGKLYRAAKAGNKEQFQAASDGLKMETSKLTGSLTHAAQFSPDTEAFETIRQTQNDLGGLVNQVITAGQVAANNPGNEINEEHLDGVLQVWEDKVKKVENVVGTNEEFFKSADLVSADQMALQSRLTTLDTSQRAKDAAAVDKAMTGVVNAIQRMIVTADREIQNTDDSAYQNKLKLQLSNLKKALTNAQASHQKLRNAPDDPKAMDQVRQLQGTFLAAAKDLEALIREYKAARAVSTNVAIPQPQLKLKQTASGAALVRGVAAAVPAPSGKSAQPASGEFVKPKLNPIIEVVDGEEMEIVDGQEPDEPLSPEETQSNPIKAAARDLKVNASKYSTYANPMVELMQSMAGKMEGISNLYKENSSTSKQELSKNTKSMQSDISELVKQGRKILDSCSDKALKAQLTQAMERMETLSTQLRIVTAVKIAEARDVDSERQLVLCSQNLMNAVKTMLKASEAASLRSMSSAATVATAAIKFRKVLYTKGPRSPSRSSTSSPITPQKQFPMLRKESPLKTSVLSNTQYKR
jgi:hypothetical protein